MSFLGVIKSRTIPVDVRKLVSNVYLINLQNSGVSIDDFAWIASHLSNLSSDVWWASMNWVGLRHKPPRRPRPPNGACHILERTCFNSTSENSRISNFKIWSTKLTFSVCLFWFLPLWCKSEVLWQFLLLFSGVSGGRRWTWRFRHCPPKYDRKSREGPPATPVT